MDKELSLEAMEQVSGGAGDGHSSIEIVRWLRANPKYGDELRRVYEASGRPEAAHYLYNLIETLNLPFEQKYVPIAVIGFIANL